MKNDLVEIEEFKDDDDSNIIEEDFGSPFSTKDIKITNAVISMSNIIERLKYNEIDLNPDFQRNANLWSKKQMSRLIESILLKLPLPVFYFDVSDPDKWIVVDGLQRLSTLKKFIIDNTTVFKLKDLEFLKTLNNKTYIELDRNLQRVINETQIITYQIEGQTPKPVRYSIFNRINTGGLSLNAQEIRQALNQKGKGVKFLEDLCNDPVFKKVVGVRTERMLDRELALRFIAFKLIGYENFKFNNIRDFLDESMGVLDSIQDIEELSKLKNSLIETLLFSEKILGENHRFSRSIAISEKTNTLNRSLFDVITTCFSEIQDKENFLQNKEKFNDRLITLLRDENNLFSKSITEGTSGKSAVESRFKAIKDLIEEVVNEPR